MASSEYQPGEPAPSAAAYEELNIFGTPTGRIAVLAKDETFPPAARGFRWRPLSDHSVAELRARAAEYRRMAQTARTPNAMDSLRRLAERFDAMADQREREEGGGS